MLLKKENKWNSYSKEEKKWAYEFSDYYKIFLDKSKTEREFIKNAIVLAEKKGFENIENRSKLDVGDKVYYLNREKNLVLVIIGKEDIEKGVKFIVSHVDSPRLDLKQNPLYEDLELAFFKTNYYGGIKKYQWAAIPLALHGIVILANGEKKEICIGENENDPVFTIPDILPHLSRKIQDDRKSRDVIKGEELRVLVGSIPTNIENIEIKEKVKYAILEKLNYEYGMVEEDFLSAEFELVPAGKAKDIGFDRSMIGGYGQDDRICAYTSMISFLDISKEENLPNKTIVCYLVDKEEIGSTGSTGLESNYLEYFMSDIIYKLKENYNDYMLKKTLWNSEAISADVNVAMDPIYKSVHDESNAAKLGYGIVVTKYTGHGGKYGASDADAEFMYKIRDIFNKNNIVWQTGTLGKVDEGGGGTVAKFLAHFGIKTIDVFAHLTIDGDIYLKYPL